ncbi:MAG: hypothetical protein KF693_00025 [Nitrospira sp.]|nr:hypothetical protein [Nitrospira sp.]
MGGLIDSRYVGAIDSLRLHITVNPSPVMAAGAVALALEPVAWDRGSVRMVEELDQWGPDWDQSVALASDPAE